ncbi:MAG: phosphate ABC transporter permease subunit PstC [Anaerolineales bacterium]|nr:MAG: phosphate ABC transporter permease subunit PstC [Anaerolineales bacterium]
MKSSLLEESMGTRSTGKHSQPIPKQVRNRSRVDRLAGVSLSLLACLPVLLLIAIISALWVRARLILATGSLWMLLSSEIWHPMRAEFGFLPFILGTLWVTGVAMFLAVPPALLSAIYLAEYARPRARSLAKPLIDLLAAIPSVVYGVWGVIVVVPWVGSSVAPQLSRWLGFWPLFSNRNPTGFGILAGGIVLAVMVVPFISSVTYEVLQALPAGMREASLALGATRWQTIKHALLPQALPGVAAGIVFGASRALGETMAVLMVVGNVIQVPHSIFDAAYPLPALIANNYGEMLSIPLYDAALLAAALVLLLIVLIFNLLSTLALRRIIRSWSQ